MTTCLGIPFLNLGILQITRQCYSTCDIWKEGMKSEKFTLSVPHVREYNYTPFQFGQSVFCKYLSCNKEK